MRDLHLSELIGQPALEALQIEADRRELDDAYTPYPGGIPDEVGAEMAAAFGWDVPPTDEELEADYAARRCDEAELLAQYAGLQDRLDCELIELIASPLG